MLKPPTPARESQPCRCMYRPRPDAITALAVPNPGVSSQIRRFFRVWEPGRLPRPADHPAYIERTGYVRRPVLSTFG